MNKTFALLILILAIIIPNTACARDIPPQGTSEITTTGAKPQENSPAEPTPKITEASDLTVILHAGGGLDGMRLLNCQEAFAVYYEMGYRYFEYDFKLSAEGKLIATHSWEHLDGGYDGMPY